MSGFVRDVRCGVRRLLRSRVSTVPAVLCLSVGIGATVAVFSVINSVLLNPLPFREPDRLVVLRSVSAERALLDEGVSGPDFRDWKEQARSFESMAAFHAGELDLIGGERTDRLQGLWVSRDFFSTLGVRATLGRAFSDQEHAGGDRALVLGQGVWRRRFDSNPNLVGESLAMGSWSSLPELGAVPYTVVGVVPSDVSFLPVAVGPQDRAVGIDDTVDFWTPLEPRQGSRHERRGLEVIARLKPDVSVAKARAEMNVVAHRLGVAHPDTNRGWQIRVIPLREHVLGGIRPTLTALMSAVAFVLLIVCANVANLTAARNRGREGEMAIRVALGAGRGHLMRQLLVESLLLAVVGGGLGGLLALWGIDILIAVAPPGIPRLDTIHIDARIAWFTAGVTLLCGMAVGLAPALHTSRPDLNASLKADGRTATAGPRRRRFASGLVAGELATTLVLLIGASLMIRSFIHLRQVDPGFEVENLLSMTISLPKAKYEWQHNSVFCNQVIQGVEALPGVASAAVIRGLPMSGTNIRAGITIEGRPSLSETDLPVARIRVVSPHYFDVTRIPLRRGRLFRQQDSVGEIGDTKVAIINKTMARRFWPDEDPLGKRFNTNPAYDFWIEVVGVVGDVNYMGLDREVKPDIYFPEGLFPQAECTLVVRVTADPARFIEPVRSAVQDVERVALVTDVKTMEQVLSESIATRRFSTSLLTIFSAVALVLAATGVYGVIAQTVSHRRHEIGVRMALGAGRKEIVGLIVQEGIKLALWGVGIGVLAAFALTRVLAASLYGVSPVDPATFVGTPLLLIVVAAVASYLPARRAARIEPAIALRDE